MDTPIIAALITGAATVIATGLALLPALLRKRVDKANLESYSPMPDGTGGSRTRFVYYKGTRYRFLNFGGQNCRIEPIEGGQSSLAPTHELFHDQKQTRRVTRDSIVLRA
jgi:hypothetical protein